MFRYKPFTPDSNWKFNGWSRVLPGVFECDKVLKESLIIAAKEVSRNSCENLTLQATRALSPKEYLLDNFEQPITCMAIDFAITEHGPQLIELQSFSSIYATILSQELHHGSNQVLDGRTLVERTRILNEILREQYYPGVPVIMDINPSGQSTAFDFEFSHHLLGVEIADPSQLIRHKKQIMLIKNGCATPVSLIWNRIVPTDIPNTDMDKLQRLFRGADVSWFGHMDHFFSVSKATMPHLRKSQFIPSCGFLPPSDITLNEHEIVIKPLYDYAGRGVIISPSREDIINASSSMIWQKKVMFSDSVHLDGRLLKGEVRVMLVYTQGDWAPICMMMRASASGFSSQSSAYKNEPGGVAAIV